MIEFVIPQTPADILAMAVQLLTGLAGLALFLMPRVLLTRCGLEARPASPEAIGEGRASFAGFLIGASICCLLFQQPGLQQPGLSFALAACWLFAALGKMVHVVIDGSRCMHVYVRLGVAVLFGGVALWTADPVALSFVKPQSNTQWYSFLVALVTFGFGVLAFALPKAVLAFLRLQPVDGKPAAFGEIRGTLAGFHIGVGGTFLLAPGIFTGLMLSICWLASAFGRMISMLSDRGNTALNWLKLAIELGLGVVPLAIVFGFIV